MIVPLTAVVVAVMALGVVGGGSGVMRLLGLAHPGIVQTSSAPPSMASRPRVGGVAPSPGPASSQSAVRWRDVLHRLDRARARAWRRGDPGLLRAVYTSQSPALNADRHVLGDYVRRGLRVRDVHLRFGRLDVVEHRHGYVRLTVVDRLAAATVVSGAGRLLPLPRDRPTRHRVVLRRVDGGWRIDRVMVV